MRPLLDDDVVAWAADSAFVVVVLLKGVALTGMVVLHTKVKFKLAFRSEQQSTFLSDPEAPDTDRQQPSLRGGRNL